MEQDLFWMTLVLEIWNTTTTEFVGLNMQKYWDSCDVWSK